MADVKGIVDEMRGEYVAHCRKQLVEIDNALNCLSQHAATAEHDDIRNEARRHVHSIKGSAYTFGLPEISLFCAAWEGHMLNRATDETALHVPAWQRLLAILTHLFERAGGETVARPPAGGTDWGRVLVWTPYQASRGALADLVRSQGAEVILARTDREAVLVVADQSVDTVLSCTDTDTELTQIQRARLIGSTAAGIGAVWLVNDSESDIQGAAVLATMVDAGAVALSKFRVT